MANVTGLLESLEHNDQQSLSTLIPMDDTNLDCLNDETFGSEALDTEWSENDIPSSKVEEFEKWKEEQKSLMNKVPLDEAPARKIPEDEERMAQAMSKLDTIDHESTHKNYPESLLNADSIEAIWTTPVKHSSNINTPDSPYLQDLLTLTGAHNIWGSPSSEEKKAWDETDETDHNKSDDSRTSFSPVLEDEAIVSALPKRIQKPMVMHDLERVGFVHHSGLQPARSFLNGVNRIPPPPGLSPHPNMGRLPPQPFNMYQPSMTASQAQAYYAATMKQRMAFVSPYRTPVQPLPRPFYHSDPGHLRYRPPNLYGIPPHQARFITPPPRYWMNNNSNRGGRRRPQHYFESPKYRPQYYISSEDEDDDDGALMTAREKDWIIRIQLMQLTTDKPELDDYYFHTFERRRLAEERASRSTGVERETEILDKDAEMTLPHVTKGESHYKPTKFQGSLGQVSVGSVQHPREVVQVGDSGRPNGPVGSLKETKKKYQLLMTIEKGFDYILPIEDLERMALEMPQDVRPQLYERRDKLFQRCYDLLGLKPSNDSNKKFDDETLLQMLSVRKGRRLLSKMLRTLKEAQRHDIALAITRNTQALTKKDVYNEGKDSLCEAVLDTINTCSSDKLVEHYNNIVGEQNGSVLQLFSSKFTLKIVIKMMKRTAVVANNIDEDSVTLQTIWPAFLSLAIRDFVTASPKVLAKNYEEVGNLVDVFNDNAEPSKKSIIQEHYRSHNGLRNTKSKEQVFASEKLLRSENALFASAIAGNMFHLRPRFGAQVRLCDVKDSKQTNEKSMKQAHFESLTSFPPALPEHAALMAACVSCKRNVQNMYF